MGKVYHHTPVNRPDLRNVQKPNYVTNILLPNFVTSFQITSMTSESSHVDVLFLAPGSWLIGHMQYLSPANAPIVRFFILRLI